MKKFAIIFLTLTFLLTNTGLTVYAHYCGKLLVESGISKPEKKCCNSTKQTSKKDCCQKKSQQVQVKDKFVKASSTDKDDSIKPISYFVTELLRFIISPLANFGSSFFKEFFSEKSSTLVQENLIYSIRSIRI